jgi:hypothetical protein
MRAIEQAIRRINAAGKGLWGFECPEGTRFDKNILLDDPTSLCVIELLSVRDSPEGRYFEGDQRPIQAGFQLNEFAKRQKAIARERGVEKVRIVIDEFHLASAEEQNTILREARLIQESEKSIALQFLVCGRWSHHLSKSYHIAQHGNSLSPQTDAKNSHQVPYATEDEVLKELTEHGKALTLPTDLDRIGCAFLLEQTAGDWYLIQQAIDGVNSSPWTDSIEQSVSELASSPEVISEIERRLNLVDDGARTELNRLLRVRRLSRPNGQNEAETLWLAGLVRKAARPGGQIILEIASPVIEAAIRNIESSNQFGRIAHSSEICFCRNSIATAAYRRVSDIENLLRNVIVTEWRLRHGNNWLDKLAETKTRGHYQEEQEEILRNLLRNDYDIEPKRKEQTDSDVELTESIPKRKEVTVLNSAQNWQRRQRNNHAVDLDQDNLMHFLTTESLTAIFVTAKNQFHGEKKMFRKEDLRAALDDYVAIRSAVAHNQPLKLVTISKLDSLLERFMKWLTVYADQPSG